MLSSDRPPSEIANLEHRLVSRFEWGLTAELQPPDVETRMAILRKKAHTLNIKLGDETFNFLATRIRTNVRRLEGALMRVASFASLSGKELTNEVVEHLLKDILQEEARHAVTTAMRCRCMRWITCAHRISRSCAIVFTIFRARWNCRSTSA